MEQIKSGWIFEIKGSFEASFEDVSKDQSFNNRSDIKVT